MSKGSNVFVKEIRARIDAYFKIAVRNVRDTIPKTMGFFLVKASQERLQFELYSQINKNEQLSKSLGEPERVAEERKQLISTNETLKKAIKVLSRDPDITNTAFGEDELEEALRNEAMQKRRDETDKKLTGPPPNMMGGGGNPQPRPTGPPMTGGPMTGPPGGMPPGGMPPGGVRPVGPPMGGPGPNPGVRPGGPGGPLGGPGPNTGNLFGNAGPLGAGGAPANK